VQKSEQTKATARRPAPIGPPPPELQVRQRLTLIQRKIQKLEEERERAVRPAGEISALDERIEKLKGEAGEWEKLLGLSEP
jgi:hypothetical protein